MIKEFHELYCTVEYLVIDDYRFKCLLNYCFNFTWQIRPLMQKKCLKVSNKVFPAIRSNSFKNDEDIF